MPEGGCDMLFWIIRMVIVGAAAGYAANRIMGRDSSDLGGNLVTGLAGSFIGSIAAAMLGIGSRNIIGSTLIAIGGACLTLWASEHILGR